jgi:hypothetical protein
MSVERIRRFQVRGDRSFASNGEFRLDFNDVPVLSLGHTYVRWVELAIDVLWANAGGAPAVVPEPIGMNILRQIQCRIAGGHTFVDMASQAGEGLYKAIWQTEGKRGESPGNATVPAGGTVAVRYKVCIPIGYLFGAAEGDDYNVPLKELQKGQASIECNWANGAAGGDFDTGAGVVTVTAASTAVRRATIVMIARPEARVGPYLTYKQQVLAGVEERPLTGNHVVHYLGELPNHTGLAAASRLTEQFIGVARTTITQLDFDGVNVVESIDAPDAITLWNRKAKTAVDMLTQHEAATTEILPIYSPHCEYAKVTHKPSSREHPVLRLEGTPATPRLLYVLSRLLDERAEAESAQLMGVAADHAASTAKSIAKTEVSRESKAGAFYRLPRKLVPRKK